MRITSKGQVTIPQEIRERAGLLPHTEVEFELGAGGKVYLRRARNGRSRRHRAVAALAGSGDIKLSTDQIMRLTRGE